MAMTDKHKYIVDGKSLLIRHGEIKDAPQLLEHIQRVDTETVFLLREPEEFTLTIEQEESYIQSQLDSAVNLLLIGEVEGKIVATCGINGSTRKRVRHTASLGIGIQKEYWGMGIGKKLIEAGIQWAKKNGIRRITLQVDTKNLRAIHLYLKMGFVIEGTLRKDKILKDGTSVDSYTMALFLEE